jgi:beta-glucanase (GH16 family)
VIREALFLLVVATPAFSGDLVKPEALGYRLVWGDEFDGKALDAAKWSANYAPKVHPPGCNNERQSYARENVFLRDGCLVLRAERKARGGMPFTSGMVSSHEKFSSAAGWFEARMKLPKGKGMWPAFWMLPQSKTWPPEIDIMEHKGRLPTRAFLTLHERQMGTRQPKSTGKEWDGPDFTADFHTFALEWRPDRLRWYVDGVERHRWDGKADFGPMYIILNLAVGGDFDGDPDAATPFPGEMEIDYVRAYAK